MSCLDFLFFSPVSLFLLWICLVETSHLSTLSKLKFRVLAFYPKRAVFTVTGRADDFRRLYKGSCPEYSTYWMSHMYSLPKVNLQNHSNTNYTFQFIYYNSLINEKTFSFIPNWWTQFYILTESDISVYLFLFCYSDNTIFFSMVLKMQIIKLT